MWVGCIVRGVESKVLVVVKDLFASTCRCKGLWCGVRPVAVIDDAEYGNNCGLWTGYLWCVLSVQVGGLEERVYRHGKSRDWGVHN